ncbi:MAG: DNA repair protein RecO [Balneolales bacterium]
MDAIYFNMLTDTSAIVFKTVAFKESSLIVTMLSEIHGKIAVMARGARRNKNKFGGQLQPGAVLDVVYYYKTTRDVQNLSKIAQKKPTWHIYQDMEKMAIALAVLELSEQLCHEHEPQDELFIFLSRFLHWLHKTEYSSRNLFPYIQIRLIELSGIGLSLTIPEMHENQVTPEKKKRPETPESTSIDSGVPFQCFLNVESGRISYTPEEGMHLPVSKSQLDYLRCVWKENKSQLLTHNFPSSEIKNLINHLDVYLKYHVDGIRDRRSDAIFKQIL